MAKKKDNDTPKVTKSMNKAELSDRAKVLIKNHPELTQNARSLFRNENGKTIVEEIVDRGDIKTKDLICPRNQGDLKDDDLRGLAVYASTLIDKKIEKYDSKMAKEDALMMSIKTKDGGKYDGKVNASTFGFILGYMDGIKKTAATLSMEDDPTAKYRDDDIPKSSMPEGDATVVPNTNLPTEAEPIVHKTGPGESQVLEVTPEQEVNVEKALDTGTPQLEGGKGFIPTTVQEKIIKEEDRPVEDTPESPIEDTSEISNNDDNTDITTENSEDESLEEGTMDKNMLIKEAAELQKKLDAIKVLVGDTKEAGVKKVEKKVEKKETKQEEKKKAKQEEKKEASLVDEIDSIAGDLEKSGDPELFKIAYQLDQISDILEGKKEASAIISEPDEKYMREFFKAGIKEGDADEKKYMNQFNTDNTKEVVSVKDKKDGKDTDTGTAKQASEKLPYQKIQK